MYLVYRLALRRQKHLSRGIGAISSSARDGGGGLRRGCGAYQSVGGSGFSREHRHANALRVAAAAREVVERGATAVCALVSPYRESRAKAREAIGFDRFLEVFVDTPLEVCETRDVKGMYRQARAGKLEHFTGVSDPYEAPTRARCAGGRIRNSRRSDFADYRSDQKQKRRRLAVVAANSGSRAGTVLR